VKGQYLIFVPHAHALHQEASKSLHAAHWKTYAGTTTSAPGCINLSLGRLGFTSTTLSAATTRHPATHALRQPLRAPRVLVFTLPAAAIYLDYTARPGASARRAARHAARRAARRRLLRLRRASGCLGTSRGSSRGSSCRSSSTTPPRPGSSSTTPPRVRVPRHVARLVTRLVAPLVVDYFARRASGCLGTSRGSSRDLSRCSSSTTSPPPRVRVTWLVAPLVVDYSASRSLVVDYSVRRDFVLRTHWLYFSHVVGRDYLSCGNTGSTSSMPRAATTSSSGRIASTIHLD
jgi:hypothetical protein